MRKSYLAALLALVLVGWAVYLHAASNPGPDGPRLALAEQEPDIEGYYTCKGVEASGKTYTGMVAIERKGDVYLVQWIVGGGSFAGVGVKTGEHLAVGWAAPGPMGQVIKGVNLYRVEKGPRLVGRWTSAPGPGVSQAETLTFLKAREKDE